MTRDFWLGVAVGPSIAIAVASLRFAARYLNRAGVWVVNQIRDKHPKQAYRRAEVGAVLSCARRARWLSLPFGSALIIAAGYDGKQVVAVRDAIYGVIGTPATINPKYLRRVTVEPSGVDDSDDVAEED